MSGGWPCDSGKFTEKLAPGVHVFTVTCIRKPLAHDMTSLDEAPSAHALRSTSTSADDEDESVDVANAEAVAALLLPLHIAQALHMQNPQSKCLSATEHHSWHVAVLESPGLGEEHAPSTGTP